MKKEFQPVIPGLDTEIKKLEKMEQAFKLLVKLQALNHDVVDLSSHVGFVTELSRSNLEESVAKLTLLRQIAARHLEQFLALLLFSIDTGSKPFDRMTEDEMAASLKFMTPVTSKLVPIISIDLLKAGFEKLNSVKQEYTAPSRVFFPETGEMADIEDLRIDIEKLFEKQALELKKQLVEWLKPGSLPVSQILGRPGSKKERIQRLLGLLYWVQNGFLELNFRAGSLHASFPADKTTG